MFFLLKNEVFRQQHSFKMISLKINSVLKSIYCFLHLYNVRSPRSEKITVLFFFLKFQAKDAMYEVP